MKAQGLPMQTIVLIIMVVVVLVAVLLFYFGGFGEGEETVGEQNVFGRCQAECLKISAGAAQADTNWDDPLGDGNYDCDDYIDINECD